MIAGGKFRPRALHYLLHERGVMAFLKLALRFSLGLVSLTMTRTALVGSADFWCCEYFKGPNRSLFDKCPFSVE